MGVAGFFDPASKWEIGRADEDFGQTFGYYGAGPGFYLMLPLLGPSNGRDLVGRVLDYPLDLAFWIGQANPDALWPSFIRPTASFNDLSGQAPTLKRQLDSQNDPYQVLRTVYSLNRQRLVVDYQPNDGGKKRPMLAVGATLFAAKTPDFVDQAVTRSVHVAATNKNLSYSCWMQKEAAPLAFFIPGLGAHRLDRSVVAYADMLYRHGYSVVTISSPFQREFMELASSQAIPGYGPTDANDVVNALRLIRDDMQKWQGAQIKKVLLTGTSHGAYLTLKIAAREAEGKLNGLSFERYVAVNPPVNLFEAMTRLDNLYNAPLAWPATERRKRMEKRVLRGIVLRRQRRNHAGRYCIDLGRIAVSRRCRFPLLPHVRDTK